MDLCRLIAGRGVRSDLTNANRQGPPGCDCKGIDGDNTRGLQASEADCVCSDCAMN